MSLFTKGYPLDKFKTELNSPVVIIYRILSIPLVIFFKLLRIHPNWVTFISFVTLFLSSYFSIIGSFAFAGIFIIITFVLDCVDGILARINNQQSNLGLKLESIHADLTLIIFPSALILGLIKNSSVDVNVLFFLVISTSIYLKWRPFYSASNVEDNPNNLSFINKVIYAQQKPNVAIRSSSILGKILFFLRYNTSTQFGIIFTLIIAFTFFKNELIIYPIALMIFFQTLFGLAVLFGSLIKKSKVKDQL